MVFKVSGAFDALVGRIVDEFVGKIVNELLARADRFDEEFEEYSSQERYYRYKAAAENIQEYVERTEVRKTRKVQKEVQKKYPCFTKILCAIIMGVLILLFEVAVGYFIARKGADALCTIEYSEEEKKMSIDIYEEGSGSFTIEEGNSYHFCFE